KPAAPTDSPNAGKTQQAPKQSDVQRQEPSSENMDSNAQRQHSRSTPASKSTGRQSGNSNQHAAVGAVRDWKAIDKNHDNLISPEEMEADLKAGKPGRSDTSSTSTTGSSKP